MNIDILDRAPQFPGGAWANHAIYGTILGIAIFGALTLFHIDRQNSLEYTNVLVLFVSAAKKIYDYVDRGPSQGETLRDCLGKTIVTCIGTFGLWLL